MSLPINEYDRCKICGHSVALDHKYSWHTTTCDSCSDNEGCNKNNGWTTNTR